MDFDEKSMIFENQQNLKLLVQSYIYKILSYVK